MAHVFPYFRTVEYICVLPVGITEVEQVCCLDNLLFAHLGAEVSIHGIEGYILVPTIHLAWEVEVLGGLLNLRFSPVSAPSHRLTLIVLLAVEKPVYIMMGKHLAVVAVV